MNAAEVLFWGAVALALGAVLFVADRLTRRRCPACKSRRTGTHSEWDGVAVLVCHACGECWEEEYYRGP